jgi:hypothetical protein
MSAAPRLCRIVALAVSVALLAGILTQVSTAQSPTPTPAPTDGSSPTASPTSTPYPVGSSTVTIRFVRAGQVVTVLGNITEILADGVACVFATTGQSTPLSVVTQPWPAGYPPFQCSKGPPTDLQFVYLTDAGRVVAALRWTGQDAVVDVELPAPAGTSPPAQLPDTGGPSGRPRAPIIAAFVFVGLVLAAGYALYAFQRLRRIKR